MKRSIFFAVTAASLFALLAPAIVAAAEVDVDSLTAKLRAVGSNGKGNVEASQAWQQLAKADSDQLPAVLTGMKGAGLISENWFRAVVETIAQNELKSGGELPVDALQGFLADTNQAPRARRLAYELIAKVDETAEDRLIPGLLDDPSLELRRDAVALALENANAAAESGKKEAAIKTYSVAFSAARALDQIKAASSKLKELEQSVDIPQHMGFVMDWHLIGPFDNTDKKGFDVAYPPEKQVDLDATYEGKVGKVGWKKHRTEDDFGIVDLNQIFERPKDGNNYQLTDEHKGTIAYAVADFNSDDARDVEIRMGCINGNKIWLNGELVTANHVYHAGAEVDQYSAPAHLKKGTNQILVKICQNEQDDSWAQRWQFQLRVCDKLGTAVLSSN